MKLCSLSSIQLMNFGVHIMDLEVIESGCNPVKSVLHDEMKLENR